MKANHCWHETGEGSTFGFFGSEMDVVCCNCGTKSVRKYSTEPATLEGHGRHFTIRNTSPKPVECETECKDD